MGTRYPTESPLPDVKEKDIHLRSARADFTVLHPVQKLLKAFVLRLRQRAAQNLPILPENQRIRPVAVKLRMDNIGHRLL